MAAAPGADESAPYRRRAPGRIIGRAELHPAMTGLVRVPPASAQQLRPAIDMKLASGMHIVPQTDIRHLFSGPRNSYLGVFASWREVLLCGLARAPFA